jgi:prevent-host-death family protein
MSMVTDYGHEMRKSREIPAGEFKAKCLKLMDDVAATGEELVITKRGKPVARLVPAKEGRPKLFGSMKGSVKILGDIIEPALDPGWEDEMLKSWDEVHGKGPAEPREDE